MGYFYRNREEITCSAATAVTIAKKCDDVFFVNDVLSVTKGITLEIETLSRCSIGKVCVTQEEYVSASKEYLPYIEVVDYPCTEEDNTDFSLQEENTIPADQMLKKEIAFHKRKLFLLKHEVNMRRFRRRPRRPVSFRR